MSVIHPLLDDRKGLVLYLAVWLLLGVVLALPAVGLEGERWRLALVLFLPPFMIFSSLCLAAWYPCRANPLGSTSAQRLIAVHLSAGLVSSLLWLGLARFWTGWLTRLPGWPTEIQPQAQRYLPLGLLFYLLAATLHYLLLADAESRQAQQRALELRVLAREAELAAYKSQIDPHFLFNCLNSISSLCGSEPDAARQMTIQLGEFLRASLRMADREFITLAEEIALARGYIDIERTRFGERLNVLHDVDPATSDFPVPSLLLQPLFENAIKHGLSGLVNGGTVNLRAQIVSDRLRLELTNPTDPDRANTRGEGIGLQNVIGRLELLYRGDAQLAVLRAENSFRVTIDLPRRTSAGDART